MDKIWILAFLCVPLFSCTPSGDNSHVESGMPAVLDDNLRLTLVAEDPDVMTPIGIAIDDADRVFVLESHTHTPPDDYTGPDSDLVKVFIDQDEDGVVDTNYVFASGINDGMNMSFGPDGQLYVVSSQAVTRYPDRNKDGVMDGAEVILQLTAPETVYDHAALLGVAATPDGWLYVARGNTGSKYWKLEGTDQSFIEGYGDGGNIIRCRLDGSGVEEVATGFWNPFDLVFDKAGRLFVIDNDPDSRGPNRLVDAVQGGDYGYKSLYGGSGIHPFLAWNGELPGTVPYITGVGEAPSGLFDLRHSSLPVAYEGHLLVTIWEESKIAAIGLREQNGALVAAHKDLVQGGDDFRPVAFAANSRGDVYFTDWVIREYPNHGKGKLWKLSSEEGAQALSPQALYAAFQDNETLGQRAQLAAIKDIEQVDELEDALRSGDPHLRAIARHVLKEPEFKDWLHQAAKAQDADLRIQAALVLESLHVQDEKTLIENLLMDDDASVRQVGLLWAARNGVVGVLPRVEAMLVEGQISPGIFDVYLAAIRHLQPAFVETYHSRSEGSARSIERALPDGYLLNISSDPKQPAGIRAQAISRLEGDLLDVSKLKRALFDEHKELQEAAIFYMMQHNVEGGAELLVEGLQTSSLSATSHEQAKLALSWYPQEEVRALSESLQADVAAWSDPPAELDAHPENEADWLDAIDGVGDKERGRLLFYSPKALCSTCHVHDGWGGIIGPDLSNIGQSKSMEQILSAILDPSAEVAPEWQGWYVQTADGATVFGRQIDVGLNRVEIMTMDGTFQSFADVAGYGISTTSLMPGGLERQMSVDEMRDLMAFLKSE